MEAGRDLGVRNAGRSVVDCLRIERVIPQLGSELSSFVTPREAAIMERVQLNKVLCEHYNLLAVVTNKWTFAKVELVFLASVTFRVAVVTQWSVFPRTLHDGPNNWYETKEASR